MLRKIRSVIILVDKYLPLYITIGGIIGFFFGGVWEGISAMVLIYIAQYLQYISNFLIIKKE